MRSSTATHLHALAQAAGLAWLSMGCGGSHSKPPPPTLQIRGFGPGSVKTNLPWVAVRDGEGPWSLPRGTGGDYEIPLADPAGRYSVLALTQRPGEGDPAPIPHYEITGWNATLQEVPRLDIHYLETTAPPRQSVVSGSLLGLNKGERAGVFYQGSSAGVYDWNPSYLFSAPRGTFDLVAVRWGAGTEPVLNRMVIHRDVSVSDNPATMPDIHVATEGFSPVPFTLDVRSLRPGDLSALDVSFWSGGSKGTQSRLYSDSPAPSSTRVHGVPAAEQRAADFHLCEAGAMDGSDGSHESRQTSVAIRSPKDVVLELPPPMTAASMDFPNSGQGSRPRITFSPSTWANWYQLVLGQSSLFTERVWVVYCTPGWLGNPASLSYTLPDARSIPGFDPLWSIQAGQLLGWNLSARASSQPLESNVPPAPVDGARTSSAERFGQLVFPE